MKRVLAPIVAIGLLAGGPALAAGDEFEVGPWIGGAYEDDYTGDLSYCAMGAYYESGHDLYFSISADYLLVRALVHQDWRLDLGATYPVTVAVDNTSLGQYWAEVIDVDMIAMDLEDTRSTIDRLRIGDRLFIETAQEMFTFDLANTAVAFPRLEQCVEMSVAAMAPPSTNPFESPDSGSSSDNPFATPEPYESDTDDAYDQSYDEDVQLTRDMLEIAGMGEYWYVPSSDRYFVFFNDADHTWSDGDTTGAMYFFDDDGTMTVAETLSAYFDMVGETCAGVFGYNLEEEYDLPDNVTLRRGFATCEDEYGVLLIPTLLWNDVDTIAVISHYADEYFSDRVFDADERIVQFVQGIYSY